MEMDMDREMGAMRREMDRDFTTGTVSIFLFLVEIESLFHP